MSEAASVYALLADGRTVEIRPATPADFDAVKAMHEAMSPDNAYLRFFSLSRVAAVQEARRVTRPAGADHAALLAVFDGKVAGLASYEVDPVPDLPHGGTTAEVAFAVADTMHHRGIATLLLEHLVSLARAQLLTALTAETLTENRSMLRVFSEAGLPVFTRRGDGVVHITIPLPPDDASKQHADYLDTVAVREQSANVASLRPLLDPRSVVVVGASRRSATVGRAVLENIKRAGFTGRLYAVNPNVTELGGVPSFSEVAGLPEPPDLALLAVPPDAVLAAAEDCGASGVRGLVVFTTGLGAQASAALLATCRRYGMRLIGPNCFGLAVPGIGLDATFGAATPLPGDVGLVMQSGGLGFALVDHLSRLGIGISSFASVGNKLDVSSNDMLMWWDQDGITKLAVLYIESFGNPRKFARTAREVGARMPVLTVLAGRTEAGQRAAAGHTDASPIPLVTRGALFDQAGIIVAPGFRELVDTTALLASQPRPGGRTVAIVSNVGGAGVLAADACSDLGLTVHRPGDQLRERLAALIPEGGATNGPVDTTASATREDFRQVLELIAADDTVDAVIALLLPTGPAPDIEAAVGEANLPVPAAAVVLNQPEAIRMLAAADGTRRIPAYGSPEAAVGAVARAARYALRPGLPPRPGPSFDDIDVAGARAVVQGFLVVNPDGGWLTEQDSAALLRCYGIARTQQPAQHGIAVTIGVTDDQMFGPLVTFGVLGGAGLGGPGLGGAGLGGADGGVADPSARFTPLTEEDADALIGALRFAPAMGTSGNLAALRAVLLRVSRLSDDLPEVAQLDLNPVLAQPTGVVVAGARVLLAPPVPQDPFLRRLR
jgi:acyl-CoA synthetase (NDP forming)/GNAT superfamily N-acetyltransferase